MHFQSASHFLCMITSASNDKIRFIRALSERKNRQREGRFVVEGARLIDDALAANLKLDWVLCAEKLPARARQTVHRLRAQHIEVIDVSDAIINSISDTESPQGVIAVLPFPRLDPPPDLNLVLVIDSLRDPGNLGTLLRSAAAADVDLVILSPETVDAYNPKVVRGAMGAHFRVPILALNWDEISQRLHGLNVYLASMDGEVIYSQIDWTRPSALIVGSEAEGVSEQATKLATTKISIPIANNVESLNAAVAASVILFEAKRQRG
jgi:RNA methyltransferase, TrmH family